MDQAPPPSGKTCSARGFKALMVTQFLGALNDNVYKLVVSLIVVNALPQGADKTLPLSIAGAVFVLPFILFSPYAGFLSDRFSKTVVIKFTKVFEVVVMSIGFVFLVQRNFTGLYFVLFLMGFHSAVFSPAKFGILPEILKPELLSKGNGYLNFWTFLAIILGTVLGGQLVAFSDGGNYVPGIVVLSIALFGLFASFFITKTPSASPKGEFPRNPFREIMQTLREIRHNRNMFLVLLAIAYFWFVGALFQFNTILYAKELLGLGDVGTGLLLTVLAVGIGIGSIIAGKVSEGKVELGLIPLGAIGMSVWTSLLWISSGSAALTMGCLLLLGLSGGFFIVPLSAFMQQESPESSRGRYLATTNFCSFSGMLLASGFLTTFSFLDASELFLLIGILSFGVTFFICKTLPVMLVRCINWVLIHTLYRVRVFGREHLPRTGGALLVCNHLSFVDPSLLLGVSERPIRFLMYKPIYEMKSVHPIASIMKAIPVQAESGPKALLRSLQMAREAIEQGDIVGLFPEGQISRVGSLLSFHKGLERIVKDLDVPIIPAFLDQVWGSIFSFRDGRFFWKRPKEIPYPVTVVFGKPLPSSAKAPEVYQAVQELGSDAFRLRKEKYRLLHIGFLNVCKRHPFRQCIADSSGRSFRYLSLLVACLSFSKLWKRLDKEESMVGVFLPPSVPAVISNLSLLMAGRVPVNLNYTSGEQALASAIRQCKIKTIITSKAFEEKVAAPLVNNKVFVEDILAEISLNEKVRHFLTLLVLPLSFIKKIYIKKSAVSESLQKDQLATVIFSSGSTGEPKGVMLSHGNISSNIESLYDVFQLQNKDVFLGVLPFFHSFGFTGTLFLPLLAGVKVVYHPNPIDAGVIGELSKQHQVTVLMATPTFLLNYIRKCSREQFASLKHIVVGAEKLKTRVAEAFQEKFGLAPLEGYGCTELSPVAIMNTPNFERKGIKQTGYKLGTVGHPIPGVVAKVVDPETGSVRGANEEGLLLIKGPNVMLGYLGSLEKTNEVIRDGWYVTGDLAIIDEEGFVTITDRLSRFSKIGGEMVPHGRIEEEIQKIVKNVEPICVVTGVPDEKKGEKLVVLHTISLDAAEITAQLSEGGLPNLWIPKKENFYKVDSLPLLGSGKLDLKSIKNKALELCNYREITQPQARPV